MVEIILQLEEIENKKAVKEKTLKTRGVIDNGATSHCRRNAPVSLMWIQLALWETVRHHYGT